MRCKDWFIDILLGVEEESRAYQEAAEHVEHCPGCQRRLIEMSGDDTSVAELCETLRTSGELTVDPAHQSSVVISIESLMGEDNPIDCEPVSLSFLAAPSHPEMLGRIGRYEVERLIGVGGMGIVLKGFDSELHRVVAIKVLMPHLANSAAARRRFAREAQAAAAVVHEHVIPIYNVETDGDLPYLVMQYVPGKSLQARVDEEGPLEIKDVLRIARQAAAGLAAAHAQGLVHRDVKPANMLLEESVDRVLISDFGLARTVDDAGFTRTGTVAGTPHYMSPEQASGDAVDHRSDLYSLGSSIYFMCTGRPPFRSESAMAVLNRICHEKHRPLDEVNSDVPAELVELVDRLLAKDPDKRFPHAAFVESRLAVLLAEMQAGRKFRRRRFRLWLKRTSTMQRILLGTAAALFIIAAGLTMAQFRSVEPLRKSAYVDELNRDGPAREAVTRNMEFPGPRIEAPSARRKTQTIASGRPVLPPDTFAQDWAEADQLLNGLETPPSSRISQSNSANIDTRWDGEILQIHGLLNQIEATSRSVGSTEGTPSKMLSSQEGN
ncbi:MAG: serine/threonine-protein kinase [Planctomycetaceae bacterium]